MGSAALARCALRHASVIGIEQFARGHSFGASSGESRIIRQAYFEDAAYVPLLRRAYELWRDVEERTDARLMQLTGLLMAGPESGEVIAGSLAAAKLQELPVDYLSARDVRERWPNIRIDDDEVAVFERIGGVVFPEAAVEAHLRIGETHGSEMRFGVALEDWHADDSGVTLTLSDRSQIRATSLVLTLGPWFEPAFAALGIPLTIQRNVQTWFQSSTDAYDAANFPAFLIERAEHPILYGFPNLGDGIKAAFHGHGEATSPSNLRRDIDIEDDVQPVARALESWMPGAADAFLRAKVCMYALTPDRNFVIDRHPAHDNVVLCGGFSGHGFKFASVVGEIAAELALETKTPHDIRFLSIDRFNRARQA